MSIIDDLKAEVEHSKSVVAAAKKVYEDQDASSKASQADLEAQLTILLAELKATHDELETFVSAKATASAKAPAAAAPTLAGAAETTMPLQVA